MVLLVFLVVAVMVLSAVHEIVIGLKKPLKVEIVETVAPKETGKVKSDVYIGIAFIVIALVLSVFDLMILGYAVGLVGILCIVFAEN